VEFITGNNSEEDTSGTEESDEDIKLGDKPFLKKQKEQLRTIYDLIEDIDSKAKHRQLETNRRLSKTTKKANTENITLSNTKYNSSG
jgi:hypothetical protein